MWNADFAGQVRIQYGGSMKPENAKGLMGQTDVDGGLIGGAALKADSFLAIVERGEVTRTIFRLAGQKWPASPVKEPI